MNASFLRISFNAVVVILLVWILLPLVAIVAVSFGFDAALSSTQALTFKWYTAAWEVASFRSGILTSALVACCATLVATVVGVSAAIGLNRWTSSWKSTVDMVLLLPVLVPGLVTGIGLLEATALAGFDLGHGRLIAGHALVIMPYVIRTTYSCLMTQGNTLEEAARTLGAKELRILLEVTLPLARPGIIAGMVFAFIISLDEVPVSLFLADARSNTLPLAVLSYLQYNFDPAISAISAAQVILTVAAALLLERMFGLKNLYGAEHGRA
ncbi:ABC transporter permease [Variovorax sp. LjRoot290]|uniref:ABC transporter permease n=1 Tax=unclassified Variovorax TaxID=663243 RepID=UPI003ED13389